MIRRPPLARGLFSAGALVALTICAYLPVWHAGLVWNDADYITRPALRGLHGLLRIWTQPGATEQYYPLLHSAFWVEYHLWGAHPLGYHVLNVLLHSANAILFAQVLRLVGINGRFSSGTAWFAAAVFAVHPVMAESVAWISEQKNTFSLLFYLLAADGFLRGRNRLPFALFLCALLTKTTTASLPGALLVVAWWRRSPNLSGQAARLVPWWMVAAAAGLFSAWVEHRYVGARGSAFALTAGQRLLLAARIPWFYASKLIWPARLVFIYPRWNVSPHDPRFLLAAAATLAATLAGFALARRGRRGPLAGWLFFIGSLLPTSGLFNIFAFVYSYVADHWDYIPALGAIAAAALGARSLLRPLSAPTLATLAGALVLWLGWRTQAECRTYRNAGVFYETILARNPAAWMAANNLGDLLAAARRYPEAIAAYNQALKSHPGAPEILYNRAVAEAGRTEFDAAAADLDRALAAEPGFALAHTAQGELRHAQAVADNNEGVKLLQAGEPHQAARHFGAALQHQSEYPEAWANLGRALLAEQRPAEALAPFEEALRLQPRSPETENDLGAAFLLLGRPSDAVPHFETALRLAPDFDPARRNLQAAGAALPPH